MPYFQSTNVVTRTLPQPRALPSETRIGGDIRAVVPTNARQVADADPNSAAYDTDGDGRADVYVRGEPGRFTSVVRNGRNGDVETFFAPADGRISIWSLQLGKGGFVQHVDNNGDGKLDEVNESADRAADLDLGAFAGWSPPKLVGARALLDTDGDGKADVERVSGLSWRRFVG